MDKTNSIIYLWNKDQNIFPSIPQFYNTIHNESLMTSYTVNTITIYYIHPQKLNYNHDKGSVYLKNELKNKHDLWLQRA